MDERRQNWRLVFTLMDGPNVWVALLSRRLSTTNLAVAIYQDGQIVHRYSLHSFALHDRRDIDGNDPSALMDSIRQIGSRYLPRWTNCPSIYLSSLGDTAWSRHRPTESFTLTDERRQNWRLVFTFMDGLVVWVALSIRRIVTTNWAVAIFQDGQIVHRFIRCLSVIQLGRNIDRHNSCHQWTNDDKIGGLYLPS